MPNQFSRNIMAACNFFEVATQSVEIRVLLDSYRKINRSRAFLTMGLTVITVGTITNYNARSLGSLEIFILTSA